MKAIIMAGGRGERLRPLTDTLPKPMIDVNGKPVLEHIVNFLKKYGISDFIFTLCHLPEKITSYFGDGSRYGIHIEYIYENPQNPLGTAGGIALAKKYIDGTFIVASGDILRILDVKHMMRFHEEKKSAATLNVYKRFGANPKSMIAFDKTNRIIEFVERPKPENREKDFVWANGSFYIFEQELFDYIPVNKPSDFGKDVFPQLLKAGKKMYVFPTSEYFVDIGNLEKLETARKTFIS